MVLQSFRGANEVREPGAITMKLANITREFPLRRWRVWIPGAPEWRGHHILAGAPLRRLRTPGLPGIEGAEELECAMQVSIAAAFAAGMLSFLSPCVLPLVPPYLVYMTGTSLERLADAEPEPRVRRETVAAALLFVLGFSTVFVTLGASASAVGALLRAYSGELAIAAGVLIIVMGLHFLGLTPIALLMREKRMEMVKPVGLWGAYLMGLAFALGWTPCIGPILAAILAVAASEETVAKGAGMLAVYSLGLGIPFIVAAFAIEPFAAFLTRFRAHLGLVEKAMGGLLILTGVAFLTGAVSQASFWLLETFPLLGKIG